MSFTKKTVFAGLFGNALEWYDFILYANFAPIIANLFFPVKNPIVSILLTFAVFATGFLVRPLGALLFGYIGDHLGRRVALLTSICLITIPTILIGFIPTYNTVGLAAPMMLIVLRVLQGIAVSGELTSASTFLVEHAPEHRRGFAGCLVMSTAFLGILVGAIISSLASTYLSSTALSDWGWRATFWFGGILGILGIFIRLKSSESPKFLETSKEASKTPFKYVFLHFRKELFLSVALTGVMGLGNYILIAYVVTFLVKFQGFSLKDANIINLISLLFLTLLLPVMGILSDLFGRKPVFKAGVMGFVIFSLPIFWLLSQKQFGLALCADLLLCLVLAPVCASIPTLLAELFPTTIRNTGAAIGYNVALAIFGGTAPLFCISLVQITGSNLAPAAYLILCALLSVFALGFIKESYKSALA